MPLTNRVKPRIGDLIEISTPKGLSYAHFTHKHETPPRYGSLIRVLPGIFPERPTDFAELVRGQPLFSTFFPLGSACQRNIVRVVASEPIPLHTVTFPTFRSSRRDRSGKRVGTWFLWDGQRKWNAERLTEQQLRDYPPLGIWNDTLLIERIIAGWRNEHDS